MRISRLDVCRDCVSMLNGHAISVKTGSSGIIVFILMKVGASWMLTHVLLVMILRALKRFNSSRRGGHYLMYNKLSWRSLGGTGREREVEMGYGYGLWYSSIAH